MNFKHYLYAVAMLATLGMSTTACDDDEEVPVQEEETTNPGEVFGTWEAGSVINVTDKGLELVATARARPKSPS